MRPSDDLDLTITLLGIYISKELKLIFGSMRSGRIRSLIVKNTNVSCNSIQNTVQIRFIERRYNDAHHRRSFVLVVPHLDMGAVLTSWEPRHRSESIHVSLQSMTLDELFMDTRAIFYRSAFIRDLGAKQTSTGVFLQLRVSVSYSLGSQNLVTDTIEDKVFNVENICCLVLKAIKTRFNLRHYYDHK